MRRVPQRAKRARTIRERLRGLYHQQRRHHDAAYQDLLDHVTHLLWNDLDDVRPVQLLYTYFVMKGSDVMEPTLQDVGHTLMRNHGVSFDQAQMVLNMIIRRLAAIGRMRHMHRERQQHNHWNSREESY